MAGGVVTAKRLLHQGICVWIANGRVKKRFCTVTKRKEDCQQPVKQNGRGPSQFDILKCKKRLCEQIREGPIVEMPL